MATKKTKRYDDGGVTDDMRSAAEAEGTKDDGPDSTSTSGSSPAPTPAARASLPSFKEAFASARKSGDKTFTWNGKLYGTQLASSSAPKTTKTSNYSNEGRGSVPTVVTPRARSLVDQGRNVDLYGGAIKDIGSIFGKSKVRAGPEAKMAKGGSASSRADGIASKGKTRGKMC
jgi:hypothetical protein